MVMVMVMMTAEGSERDFPKVELIKDRLRLKGPGQET